MNWKIFLFKFRLQFINKFDISKPGRCVHWSFQSGWEIILASTLFPPSRNISLALWLYLIFKLRMCFHIEHHLSLKCISILKLAGSFPVTKNRTESELLHPGRVTSMLDLRLNFHIKEKYKTILYRSRATWNNFLFLWIRKKLSHRTAMC